MDAQKIIAMVAAAQAAYALAMEMAVQAKSLLGEKDQQLLKQGLKALQAENDAGHQRLQEKLDG